MKLPELSVRRPMVVSMIFLGVILFGLYALNKLPIDLFPKMDPPYLSVITFYLGASATDVEDKVTEPIEDSLGLVADAVIPQVGFTSAMASMSAEKSLTPFRDSDNLSNK